MDSNAHREDTTVARRVPGAVELDASSGTVHIDRTALQRAADQIAFGRGIAASLLPKAVEKLVCPERPGIVLIVGESSSKAGGVASVVAAVRSLRDDARASTVVVKGHADHATIRSGIEAVQRSHAGLVIAIGGGTVIDVGKSVAALAYQEYEAGASEKAPRTTPSSENSGKPCSRGPASSACSTGPASSACSAISAGPACPAPHGDSAAYATGAFAGLSGDVDAERPQHGSRAGPDLGIDIAAYQVGRRRVAPERALPWVAVPTTSGTGSENTDNAVVELGDEKRSIRGIPAPRFIAADPSLTDPLPLAPTITAAVDALAQSLEVYVSAAASPGVQEVALAAFGALASAIEGLLAVAMGDAGHSVGDARLGRPSDMRRGAGQATPYPDGAAATAKCVSDSVMSISAPGTITTSTIAPSTVAARAEWAVSAGSANIVTPAIRDVLSWGSLLMGLAFANSRLGLPHALVHFCRRFRLSHGNMVGIVLVPGLEVHARDDETARRLARAARTLDRVLLHDTLRAGNEGDAHAGTEVEAADLLGEQEGVGLAPLFRWLTSRIAALFEVAGLPCTLHAAGLTSDDLDWIAVHELENGPSVGIPARPATFDELRHVLEEAYGTD